MAHVRKRHLTTLLNKSLKFSPIVGLLGHRQAGKTTLAEIIGEKYITLDSPTDSSLALTNSTAFLAQNAANPLVIDECQLAPPLFPALKEWVRIKKSPGQFLLTGSVRFSSRKAIRESLTGRIITWELLPMDWAEQNHQSLKDSLIRLADRLNVPLKPNSTFTLSNYRKHVEMGGLPGVFGVRDSSIRAQRFETQINTILERDLRLLLQTTLSYTNLRALFTALAKQVGSSLEITALVKETRISQPTIRKLLPIFESLFLIRMVPSEGSYSKPMVFLEDLGEFFHLLSPPTDDHRVFVSFLFQNLRTQLHYRPELKARIFSFRTKAGHYLPFCFSLGGDKILGIVPLEQSLDLALSSARQFRRTYPKAKVLIVSLEDNDTLIEEGVRWVGVGRLI